MFLSLREAPGVIPSTTKVSGNERPRVTNAAVVLFRG